ncbi:hypothetical protein FIV07_09240 [Mycobacterium sp. THAF192]|nr:hypothetical protein FIV07_09240 [Mycobacterium sp. THAF192]
MTAAMLVPLVFPDSSSPTTPRMKATGSKTQPMMSAPGIHAKIKPMMPRTSAINPGTFLSFETAGCADGGGASVQFVPFQ